MVHVLQTTQNLVISRCCFAEDGKEMCQDSKRTCTAIVLLIKPFVWWRSRCRCRCRRGFVNSLLSADKYPCIFSRQMATIVYITPARVDICPPILSVEEKHSKRKNFNFLILTPESTKKSPKYAVNDFEGEESHE